MIRLSSSLLSIQLADKISKSMIFRYRINRELSRNELTEKYKKPVYFAHELTQCPLKRAYAELLPEKDLETSFKPSVMIGEIVENGLENYLKSLEFEKVKEPCVMEFQNYVIAGSPDYINVRTGTLLDVKYSEFPIQREHHIERMQIYLTICKSEEGILLYISPSGIKSFSVKTKMDPRTIAQLASFQSIPRYKWECKYCNFQDFCPSKVISTQGDEHGK